MNAQAARAAGSAASASLQTAQPSPTLPLSQTAKTSSTQSSSAAAPTPLHSSDQVRAIVGDCRPALAARRLVAAGLDRLPLPGAGQTLQRWRALAAIGATDLALAKIYEGHTDALAIFAELSPATRLIPGSLWAVWAAEAAGPPLSVVGNIDGEPLRDGAQAVLCGVKPWCSAAADVTHGLVTAQTRTGVRQLFAVAMNAACIRVDSTRWNAVGMASSASADVHFDQAPAIAVGAPGAYLSRPGFWQGGAGVAACWLGAARALAGALLNAPAGLSADVQVLRALALGRVTVPLTHSAHLMTALAQAIDDDPSANCGDAARLLRLSVDQTARDVLAEVMRALGPAPFCRDPALARLAADLPVFVRQCHGDGDLLQAGRVCQAVGTTEQAWPW